MDIKQTILSDIRVELTDEFDQNFERKAFFDRPWAPAKHDPGIGSLMIRTARLRNSIRSSISGDSIRFDSDTAYAAILNTGGVINRNITVTPKMRRWAWAMYHNTKNEMYKGMALTKKQSIRQRINMPARTFIGYHPAIDKMVNGVVTSAAQAYFGDSLKRIIR
jgi:phage gpG-like protein